MAIFVTLCSLTSIRCGLTPGACEVLQMDNAFKCETHRTVAAHIHGNPIKEQTKDNSPMIHKSKLKPAPLVSLCSFLFKSTPVSSVSINNKIPTNMAGMIAANIQPVSMALAIPPGLINQPLSVNLVGKKPLLVGSPMVIF